MSNRITKKMLENLATTINEVTGNPTEAWQRGGDGGYYVANTGSYYISYAYGGANLRRMVNQRGGATDVFYTGHIPKRELAGLMHAFLRGYDAAHAKIATEEC